MEDKPKGPNPNNNPSKAQRVLEKLNQAEARALDEIAALIGDAKRTCQRTKFLIAETLLADESLLTKVVGLGNEKLNALIAKYREKEAEIIMLRKKKPRR